ncbi:TIGR02391 family protein [Mesorhizobium sp. 128a]
MKTLAEMVPDVDLLLEMEPEELGASLLFVIREAITRNSMGMATLTNVLSSIATSDSSGSSAIPVKKRDHVFQAITEAWMWLEAQGLLIPAPGTNGQNGWKRLSRRAEKIENATDFSGYSASRYLRKELLHPRMANWVWAAFLRGEYDVAVFQSMKAVEVAVREAARLPETELGLSLMRKAFNAEHGPLADPAAQGSERDALSNLFAGAIGCYKNPHSHRYIAVTDPASAAEVVMLANQLLRIVDERRSALSEDQEG